MDDGKGLGVWQRSIRRGELRIRSGWGVSEIILAYALEVLKIQEYVVGVWVDNWMCSFFRWRYMKFLLFICLEHRPHTSVTVCCHRNINKCGIIIGLISIGFLLPL